MESRVLVSITLLTSSQSSEVLNRLWDSLAVEAHHNPSKRLVAMADIEVDLVGDLRALNSLSGLGKEEEGDCKNQ